MAGEQFRKQAQHDLPVLQHVGDARGRADIVLENVERISVHAHDVDARDEDIDVMRNALAVHFRTKHRILEHEVLGDDAGTQDLPLEIDVLDVQVDGFDSLLESATDEVPLTSREDARDDVERDQPFLCFGIAIDRDGDADAPKQQFGLAPAMLEDLGRDLRQPRCKFRIGGADLAVAAVHLVEIGSGRRLARFFDRETQTHPGTPAARRRASTAHNASTNVSTNVSCKWRANQWRPASTSSTGAVLTN